MRTSPTLISITSKRENHNRSSTLERSVINYWGGGGYMFYGANLVLSFRNDSKQISYVFGSHDIVYFL